MIAFMIIPVVAVLVLYLNIRKVAEGSKGVLCAGLPIILTFSSFFLARHNSAFFSWVQCFMVIWLCQALWMYILWSLFLGGRVIYRKTLGKKPGRPQYKTNFVRNGARVILAATVLLTAGLLAYGIPNHYDYKTRTIDVPVTIYGKFSDLSPIKFEVKDSMNPDEKAFVESLNSPETQAVVDSVAKAMVDTRRDFNAAFFSDLHIDPLFRQEKLERLIAQCDSIRPDFILFGGDMADVHDSVLTALGYDKLMQRLASTAKIAAVGINGNHEAYMERSGSDPEGFLRKAGWIFLDDSTACVPANAPIACFTGRRDFQKARVFEEDRKSLKELTVENSMAAHLTTNRHFVPWIVLDHQPKGVEEDFGEFRPDFALSGHTHDGQFFPGNILINWIWPLAYGEGFLSGIHWLVSAGVDSWGPPVRAGSDTEIWVINFKVTQFEK